MNTKSPLALGLSVLLSFAVVAPTQLSAAPQNGQRAGEVDRLIPAVSIDRGGKNVAAKAKTVVDWQDLVNTQINGRARVALDDGSVLNVGSNASIKIVKHDTGAQQTELELAYGKLRTQAQKISKPDGKFEVRTAAGVAGVVGTDFYTEYDQSTKAMNVIVYEGQVKVCNLAGVCVVLKPGQFSTVRQGDNSAPASPQQATLDALVTAGQATQILPAAAVGAAGAGVGVGAALGWTIGIIAIAPVIVFGVTASHHTQAPPPTPPNPCVTNPSSCG
jgi:ferric-dicitrate binding protein FerR (iron transport regulator)